MKLPCEERFKVIERKSVREPKAFRTRNELVVIDKPSGPFSYMITDEVKKLVGAKKTGHAGTLDPKVTGVLPIAFDNGTKVLTALRTDKEYECIMHVHSDVAPSLIRKTAKSFVGRITQMPPVRSAVKRAERERSVYYLDITNIIDRDVYFTVGCEAGTYIRKICSDWGELLNSGAHMKSLRRTKSGPFTLNDAVSMDAFRDCPEKHLIPVERACGHLKGIWVDDNTIERIRHGSKVFIPGVCKFSDGIVNDELIAVYSIDGELIALGKALMTSDEIKNSDKGLVASLERVI